MKTDKTPLPPPAAKAVPAELPDYGSDTASADKAAGDLGFNLMLFLLLVLSKASISPIPRAVSVKLPEIDSAPQAAAGAGGRSVTFEISPEGMVSLATEPGKVLSLQEAAAQAGPGVPVAIAVDRAAPAIALIQLESTLAKNGTTSISINALAGKENK
jgi:biopolymer transport protein ExbD